MRRLEGSNLVFRAGAGPWLKICPPFFGDAFETERVVSQAVAGRLPAPIPEILDCGAVGDWRYLLSSHVPGAPIRDLLPGLGEAELEGVAAELGQFMRAFHAVAIPGFDRAIGPWPRYLDERLRGARELHRARGVPPAWIDRIADFLAREEPFLRGLAPPALIHADLTAEHILIERVGGAWRLSGVLDLADSMIAPAELDLVAPFLELFRGRKAPQRRLALESGVEFAGPSYSAHMMAVALQHSFAHFADWFAPELAAGATTIADIARTVFPD